MAEAKYYLIQGLVNMCQSALQVQRQSRGWTIRLGVGPTFRDIRGHFPEGSVAGVVDESKPSQVLQVLPRLSRWAARWFVG